jgi:hypothetical protein
MKSYLLVCTLFICGTLFAQEGNSDMLNWHKNENSDMNGASGDYNFFKKGKLWYVLTNDNDNIFIDLKIEDPAVQTRILKEGLTVWINMDGKQVKKMGVRYPIGSQNSMGRSRSGVQEDKLNPDGTLATPLSQANTIELIGFTSEESRRFPSDNTSNFRGSVKFDNSGILHYQLIMPVAKLPMRNSKENGGTMPFAIGIEYGLDLSGPERPGGPGSQAPPMAQSSTPPSGGSRRGGGGGGRSGGGSSGGPGQGAGRAPAGTYSAQNSLPPVAFWIKNITLASQK